MHFHIITLFPDTIRAYTDESILGRAQKSGKIKVSLYNPRDFTKDRHRKVDDRPFGGGPGMVMHAEPILRAVARAVGRKHKKKIILLSPNGKQFDQVYAKKLAKQYKDVALVCGHYEGVDARVQKIFKAERVRIGPYVLTGGEVPAMVVVDAVSRYVSGVLGKDESLEEKRVVGSETYTRPEVLVWKGRKYRVPKVLLSGHHKKIEEWKKRHNGTRVKHFGFPRSAEDGA